MANKIPAPDLTGGGRGKVAPWLPRYAESILYTLNWSDQNVWRTIVNSQPVAILCREKLIDTLSTMEWRVEPKDPSQRQEMRLKIRHYTDLFMQNKEQNYDFSGLVSHVLGDALDLPFGSGVELIRQGDKPNGKLMDYVLLDGATLFPTNNRIYPVVQRVDGIEDYVVFPKHAINRLNYSLRREITWNGWAFPPPQKIYVAIQMISKGDTYYWKMLIDTPEAGILDLMDMDKDSAEGWIESFRSLMTGIDPFKIPVLYEHTTKAEYLPFSRSPADIQFGNAISRYDSLIAGGYGLSLSSIGLQTSSNGGETLAGSIRQERNDRHRGIGLAKNKFKLFMDRCLPDELEFQWIDPDDEQQVARGRAMLSMATSHNNWISNRVISPKEARSILINSGLMNTTLPEEIPEEDKKLFDELNPFMGGDGQAGGKPQKRENMLGATQPPSAGGQGEIRQSLADKQIEQAVDEYLEYGEDAVISLKSQFFMEEVQTIVKEVFEEKKRSASFLSPDRYRSLPADLWMDVWIDGVGNYLINLRANFSYYCETVLDNKEDLSHNIRELLIETIKADFATKVAESIKRKLEI